MTSAHHIPFHAALAATALFGGLSAQTEIRSFAGIQADGYAGSAIANAGDLDGDGTEDLIVGHPWNDYPPIHDRGLVIVYSGADGRWLVNSTGSRAGMELGSSVCRVGDIDGDGVADFAAGGPDDDAGGTDAGYARVFSGATGNVIWERTGEAGSRFGTALCGVGDVDSDGRPDVAISAPSGSNVTRFGIVGIYSGRTGARIHRVDGANRDELFGASLACADIDGDGLQDLFVGAPAFAFLGADSGRVTAFRMRVGASPVREWMFYEPFVSREFGGMSVAAIGDLDGDTRAEVLVGGLKGRAFVVSGRTGAPLRTHLGKADDGYALAAAGLGDVDGDGARDYAIGAPLAGAGAGRVEVRSGRTGSAIATFGGTAESLFGASLAGIADLDGDLLADIAVGSPTYVRSDGRRVGRASVHAIDIAGTAQRYGTGCPASLPLTLDGTGSVRPGGSIGLEVTNGRPFHVVGIFLGVSNTTWNGVPLPFVLGPPAASGCSIQASADIALPIAFADIYGNTKLTLPVPPEPRLIGTRFYAQAFQPMPGPLLTTSNGIAVSIGNR